MLKTMLDVGRAVFEIGCAIDRAADRMRIARIAGATGVPPRTLTGNGTGGISVSGTSAHAAYDAEVFWTASVGIAAMCGVSAAVLCAVFGRENKRKES